MAQDKYGFDPDETTITPDNPFWDGTDGAHPAWWRGNDAGVISTVRAIRKILETGEQHGTFGCSELNSLAHLAVEFSNRAHGTL